MSEIYDSISEAKDLLKDARIYTGEQKYVETAEAMSKIDRILDDVNQHELDTGNPDIDDGIAVSELDIISAQDFEVNELNDNNIVECFCDGKLDQFDLEERLLGDEVDKMPFDSSDEDYFRIWR